MTAALLPGGTPDRLLRLQALGFPFLGLLAVEFLLGMLLNLLVPLPSGSPSSILQASPLLDIHVVFGLLLLGISVNALRLAAGARHLRATVFTGLGMASGVAAFAAGLDFAFGGQSAGASYAMSVGFIGLLLEAGYLLHLRRGPNASPAASRSAPL